MCIASPDASACGIHTSSIIAQTCRLQAGSVYARRTRQSAGVPSAYARSISGMRGEAKTARKRRSTVSALEHSGVCSA
jgi:hypothetical protein